MLVVTATFVLIGCASTPKSATDPAVISGETRIYEVFGMDCPGCHGGLEKLIEAIPGIATATASWQEKRLTLTIVEGGEVSDDTVSQAIARANFTAGERLQ